MLARGPRCRVRTRRELRRVLSPVFRHVWLRAELGRAVHVWLRMCLSYFVSNLGPRVGCVRFE